MDVQLKKPWFFRELQLDGEDVIVACRHNGKGAIDQIRVNWKNLIVKTKDVKTRVQADPSAAMAINA